MEKQNPSLQISLLITLTITNREMNTTNPFNPNIWEAEAGELLSLRTVSEQPGLHRETLTNKQTNKHKNKTKPIKFKKIM